MKGEYFVYLQSEGRKVCVILKDVLYIPELNVKYSSVTICQKYSGVRFCGDSEGLGLSFGGNHCKFDKALIHGIGKLYAAEIKPICKQNPMKQVSPEAANLAMTFDKFHSIMGNPNNLVLKETAKSHNILSDVNHRPCQHCTKAKIRMKKLT
jgi:hypothetical protein